MQLNVMSSKIMYTRLFVHLCVYMRLNSPLTTGWTTELNLALIQKTLHNAVHLSLINNALYGCVLLYVAPTFLLRAPLAPGTASHTTEIASLKNEKHACLQMACNWPKHLPRFTFMDIKWDLAAGDRIYRPWRLGSSLPRRQTSLRKPDGNHQDSRTF